MHLLCTVQQQYHPLHYMLGCAYRPLTPDIITRTYNTPQTQHYTVDSTLRGNLKCTAYVLLLSFRILYISSMSLP